jgi:hypothetical protein
VIVGVIGALAWAALSAVADPLLLLADAVDAAVLGLPAPRPSCSIALAADADPLHSSTVGIASRGIGGLLLWLLWLLLWLLWLLLLLALDVPMRASPLRMALEGARGVCCWSQPRARREESVEGPVEGPPEEEEESSRGLSNMCID